MKYELTTGQVRFDGDVATFSWLRRTIEVHPIPWMDWCVDEDSHGRDIGANDTEASNISGQYWCPNRLLAKLYLMAMSELVHGCEFVVSRPGKNYRGHMAHLQSHLKKASTYSYFDFVLAYDVIILHK